MSETHPRRVPAATWAPLVMLLAITVIVPAIVFDQFRQADAARNELLLRSVAQQGSILARMLSPLLNRPVNDVLPDLALEVGRIDPEAARVRVFIRPLAEGSAGGFYYVATNERLSSDQMAAERREILDLGVLEHLGESCKAGRSIATAYSPPRGTQEIITSITPYRSETACWAVMVSHPTRAYGEALSPGSWDSPEVRIAFGLYVLMVLVTAGLIAGVLNSVRRLTLAARALREGRETAAFAEGPAMREISEMAVELDHLVASLRRSAEELRRAGEENAHALKAPVATIRHAVEALRPAAMDAAGERALVAISRAVDRLAGLVQNIRRLDEATADSLAPQRRAVDLSALLLGIAEGYLPACDAAGVALEVKAAPRLQVTGDAELLETVLENLLDNALSFSPAGATLQVAAYLEESEAVVVVEDEGPGVGPEMLTRIFDRHVSLRPEMAGGSHFGIGLWIVQHYVAVHDGSVSARNREHGGLCVTVRLPADGRAFGARP